MMWIHLVGPKADPMWPSTDLMRGMRWSLNCLSNRWKMVLACCTTSRKYRLAFLASAEGIAVRVGEISNISSGIHIQAFSPHQDQWNRVQMVTFITFCSEWPRSAWAEWSWTHPTGRSLERSRCDPHTGAPPTAGRWRRHSLAGQRDLTAVTQKHHSHTCN